MKIALIGTAIMVSLTVAYAAGGVGSAVPASVDLPAQAPEAVIAPFDEIVVGDRYIVPDLSSRVVDQLPATATDDRYLPQRIALAELVIGERILTAEDLATIYARDLPGYTDVLLADGFRQDSDGDWYYDRFASWMRFPLNR